jgi:curli biogenesis system outer membrane secretion channel CsgG
MVKVQMLTLTIGAMFLFVVGGATAQGNRPKVAIKTFENPANFSRSTIGNGLTDILTTELQNTGKFNVLERTNVDELTKEMDFGNTEYAKNPTFAKKGNILGAQYVLMGKVTNFGYVEHVERQQKINLLGPNTIQTIYVQQADVRVDFRLIDVGTGETVISQPGEAHKRNKSQVSEMDTWYRCTTSGSITAELSSSLIGRATTEAVKDIVRKLNALSETVRERGTGAALNANLEGLASAKGQIVAEEGGGLWIVAGIGSANGLQRGDRLKVAHDNVVKDKAGKVVYKKSVDIGSMEVTDVSQADHAEVRFMPNSAPGTANPQPNDAVSVDMDYAQTLRAGSKGGAVTSAPSRSAGPVTTSSNSQLEQRLKRADSYIGDKFWSQALDEYQQAAAINPNEPRVIQGQALSHYMMGDFIEGDQSAEKLLQMGSALTVPIAHYHSMGTCTGQLTLQRGKLAFVSNKSDGFEIAPGGLAGVEVHKISKPMMANEKAPDWPVLEIRWRDAGGHEKKYQMIPYMYSKQQSLSGKNFASAFPMDDSDVREMQKFEQSMATLVQQYMK